MAEINSVTPVAGGAHTHTSPTPATGPAAPGVPPGAPSALGQLGGPSGQGTPGHGVQEAVLRLRAYRQQLLASNIANADTPGYQAVDIDFQEALRIAMAARAQEPVKLATTAPGHIAGQAAPGGLPAIPLLYRIPAQAGVDGNTVDIDVERAEFAKNAFLYEFTLDRVSMQYKHMLELFESLKD